MKQRKLLSIVVVLICAEGVASMVHPFGPVKKASSGGPLLPGASVPPSVMGIVARACQNCHSEKTTWPIYSRMAPLSWMIEKDVYDARSHMNLSRWNDYDSGRKQQILSAMGSLVRNHKMPLPRYLVLHPEARLSGLETDQMYQWTRAERRRLKAAELLTDSKGPRSEQTHLGNRHK